MRPQAIASALQILIPAKRPIMIWGSPGVGKSDLVRQDAKTRGSDYRFIDLRLSQLDPVDMRGIPVYDVKKKQTNWAIPNFLPQEGEGTLFLDELNSAPQATMAAAYQLILDRKLGDYILPLGWCVIAAGNNVGDRAIVNQMSTALRNRFVHIDFEVNLDDWCQWALMNNINPEVLSFLRFRPGYLNIFDTSTQTSKEAKKATLSEKAFATPRSWKFVSDILTATHSQSLSIEFELIKGTVGEGPAGEFLAFQKCYKDMPNLDIVIGSPETAAVPDNPATLYAISTGLAMKATLDNVKNILVYAERLPKEFQVLLVKDAVVRNREIANTKTFEKWGVKNADILL